MSSRQLSRSRSHRIVGGVAGGISDFTGIDIGMVRLVTALIVIFTGVGAILYILAWIILPEEGSATTGLDQIIGAFKSRSSNSNPHPDDLR